MGGNGAYASYLADLLELYRGDRFMEVAYIETKNERVSVVTTTTKKTDSTPMNSFTSSMYFVVNPNNHNRITTIAFYDKHSHRIKKSIDLQYDKKTGELLAYKVVIRKGKPHTIGSHWHKWSQKSKKNAGRKAHSANNVFAISKAEERFIKKALEYNSNHTK